MSDAKSMVLVAPSMSVTCKQLTLAISDAVNHPCSVDI
jgi:hypothetical protein